MRFNILGINSEICGIYVISINAAIIAMKNGIRGLVTFDIVVLPIPQPTNKQAPTVGVHRPMQRLAIIIIPK